jgi:hypothetical protein
MATNKATISKAAESQELIDVLDLDEKGRPSLYAVREPLFRLGGVVYTIPVVCSPGVSLEYLRLTSIAGEPAAVIYAMQKLISAGGYQVLVADETLTAEELAPITSKIVDRVAEGFKIPKA